MTGLFALLSIAASLSAPGSRTPVQPISQAQRREDPRLERRVSVAAPRIAIGELLELLSERSGILLRAGAQDGAADPEVCVHVEQMRVVDAMAALWSLMSYRGAEWRWQRSGPPGAFNYNLQQPLRARQLALRLRDGAQVAFEAHADEMLAAAAVSPREREKMAEEDPELRQHLSSERLWRGLKLFTDTLAPDARLQVLRGEARPQFPVEQLGRTGQEFVRSEWEKRQADYLNAFGSARPGAPPGWVRFEVTRFTRATSPTMTIQMEGLGGYGYLGGVPLRKKLASIFADSWRLPGDETSQHAEAARVRDDTAVAVVTRRDSILETRLRQLARTASVPILAFIPLEQRHDPGQPGGSTVAQYLQKLADTSPNLLWKWRDGALLLTYPSWFIDEPPESRLPWTEVSALCQSEKKGGGFLSPESLSRAGEQLTVEQLKRLTYRFPALDGVARWPDLFALRKREPRLWSLMQTDAGAPVAQVRPLMSAASLIDLKVGTLPQMHALRLTVKDAREGGTDVRSVWFQLLDAEGKQLSRIGVRSPRFRFE